MNPSAPPTTQTSVTKAQPIEAIRWWTTFNDAVLDSLVARAADSNLDLRQATAAHPPGPLGARHRRLGVSAGRECRRCLYPQRLGRGRDPASSLRRRGVVSTRSVGTSHDLYQAGFDASWELDIFGGVRRSIEAAGADVEVGL